MHKTYHFKLQNGYSVALTGWTHTRSRGTKVTEVVRGGFSFGTNERSSGSVVAPAGSICFPAADRGGRPEILHEVNNYELQVHCALDLGGQDLGPPHFSGLETFFQFPFGVPKALPF